jgi:hypothetical protein
VWGIKVKYGRDQVIAGGGWELDRGTHYSQSVKRPVRTASVDAKDVQPSGPILFFLRKAGKFAV